MVRTPCSDNNGLKKGTWTPEEDKKLIDYITIYGHWNWRLLPKFAGLARCGKSCRLRWLNYLRPNLKRGNYTSEEEETIIKLHQLLGNRWSAIAAQMPGRTDNEIKNYWHTNLKKRYDDHNSVTKAKVSDSKDHPSVESANNVAAAGNSFQNLDATQLAESCSFSQHFNSSSSESSSTSTECPAVSSNENLVLGDEFAFLDADMSPLVENFWLEPYNMIDIISAVPSSEPEYFSPVFDAELWNHDNYSSLW